MWTRPSNWLLILGLGAAGLFPFACADSLGNSSPLVDGSGGASTSTSGGVPSCAGAPLATACAGLEDYDCQTTQGCAFVGLCAGVSTACQFYADQTSCSLQKGCAWSDSTACGGNPAQCYNYYSPQQCSAQVGCLWDNFNYYCNGTPTACELIPSQSCSQQSGCTSVASHACAGEPGKCDALKSGTTCKALEGCTWASACGGAPLKCEQLEAATCDDQAGCSCDGCGATSSTSSGGPASCTFATDCDPSIYSCFTGTCINGICEEPPSCKTCTKQVDCNPNDDPCLTGTCINGMCEATPNCKTCSAQLDCDVVANSCFTGNCADGVCEAKIGCGSGDGCCLPGCEAIDADCQ